MHSFRRFLSIFLLFTLLCASFTFSTAEENKHITIVNIDNRFSRFEEAVRLFHLRYPDVEVITKQTLDSRVIATGMMSKNGDIDLLMSYELFNPMSAYHYYASGAVENLSQYDEITQYLPEYVDRFSACMVDGNLFAIPETSFPSAFCVNDMLANKLGIEFPRTDWTWTDLAEIGKQVLAYNEANGTHYYLLYDSLRNPFIRDFLIDNAVDVVGGESHFTDEEFKLGMDAWLFLLNSNLVADEESTIDPMFNVLLTIQSGMSYGNMGSKHLIVPPQFSENTRFSVFNNALMLNSNSQRKEEAVYFLSCFFSPEAVQTEAIQTSGPWFIDESRHYFQPNWPDIQEENTEIWNILMKRSCMSVLLPGFYWDFVEFYEQLTEGTITTEEFLRQLDARAMMRLGE